jgi:hypothetical protein
MKPVRIALFLFVAFSVAMAQIACEPDSSAQTRGLLNGHWSIFKAFRNQKQTETLDGVYFNFGENGKMVTNLPVGPEVETDFDLNKNIIRQKGPKVLEYQVVQVNDSILVLGIELRGMPFELHLHKSIAPANPEVMPEQDTIRIHQ